MTSGPSDRCDAAQLAVEALDGLIKLLTVDLADREEMFDAVGEIVTIVLERPFTDDEREEIAKADLPAAIETRRATTKDLRQKLSAAAEQARLLRAAVG